jgi:hypothetical protein
MTIPYACQPDRPANGYSTERKTPLRRPAKTLVALRDGLPVSLRPRLAEFAAAD